MDKDRILRIASNERKSTRYDQRQADLRNVVSQIVNGKYNQEFFTTDTLRETTNDAYWTTIITKITNTLTEDAAQHPPLSIYEYTAFVAARATQLSMGASGVDGVDVTQLNTQQALQELHNGRADFIVRRHAPSGEIWHFSGKDLLEPAPPQLRHFPQHLVNSPRVRIT